MVTWNLMLNYPSLRVNAVHEDFHLLFIQFINYGELRYVTTLSMRYLDFLWALDLIYRYYPRCHSNEMLMLADDIWKWLHNELPADSSTLIYLQSCFDSPTEALKVIWKEIQIMAGPFVHLN